MSRCGQTRRAFLTGQLPSVGTDVLPPGATRQSITHCSGCGVCAEACPSRIIVMRSQRPVVEFSRGECSFCGRCAKGCPETVFPPEPAVSFSHYAVIENSCLALNYVDCQACRDACPAGAIRFKPRRGGPFVPSLTAEACTGCGACVAVCPTVSITVQSSPWEEVVG